MGATPQRRAPGFFGGEPRSDSADSYVPLYRFVHPRYWRSWILIVWIRLMALLPFRWSLRLHQRLGRLLGSKSSRALRTVDDNLARCFPEMSAEDRAALASEYFANMGASIAELGLAWFGSRKRIQSLFEVEGSEHLQQALSQNRGVILCTGHFTPIEICSVAIRDYAPRYTLMYNRRRSRLLSEMQRRCRARYSDESYEKRNIRGLLRSLKKNAVVWFSGDEAHTGKSSAWLPFFGEPALTNTALSRIAGISGAVVVPMSYHRKPDDSGYSVRFEAALSDFPGDDAIDDTRRVVAILEDQIRECPAQYFWKQQRFRNRRNERKD